MPAACVLCRDPDGRVLLVRQRESGRWSTPGGAIEPGESPALAAAREALEETGLEVAITGLREVLGGPRYKTVYANGDRFSYVAIVYDAVVTGGKAKPDGDEVSELGWFSIAEVDALELEPFVVLLLEEGVLL